MLFYFLLLSQISYVDGASVEVDGRLGQKLVTKLKPQSLYTFMLTSKADSTGGLQHRADAMTAPNLLTRKPQLLDKSSSQSIATLQLPTVQGQANVRSGNTPVKIEGGSYFELFMFRSKLDLQISIVVSKF